jgi:hypothetical protein
MNKSEAIVAGSIFAFIVTLYDIRKAEQFKFFLDVRIKDEDDRRLNDWNAIVCGIRGK